MEKSKVLIQFLVIFRQFGDVLSFLYGRRLRGYTATLSPSEHKKKDFEFSFKKVQFPKLHENYKLEISISLCTSIRQHAPAIYVVEC